VIDLRERYRRINRKAVVLMFATLAAYAAIILTCLLWFRMKGTDVVAVGTILFQFGVIGWGLGYIFRYFEATTVRMDVSLELGERTVGMIDQVQGELKPVISDLRETVKDVKEIVREVKERDMDMARDTLSRIQKELDAGGMVPRIESGLTRIADSMEKLNGGLKEKVMEEVDRAIGEALQ
jgi:hypothetical protein